MTKKELQELISDVKEGIEKLEGTRKTTYLTWDKLFNNLIKIHELKKILSHIELGEHDLAEYSFRLYLATYGRNV